MANPISYMALQKGTPVKTSDGTELGTVAEVVSDVQKDIFSGLEVTSGILSGKRFVPADLVASITDESVELSITSNEAESKLEAQN